MESLLEDTVINESGVIVQNYTPEHEAIFAIARYASGLLLILGMVVLISGVLWKRVQSKKDLAVTGIVAGALLAAVSAFISGWGYSFDYIVAIEGGPVLEIAQARALTIITGLLGLAVLGCGIAQLKKSSKIMNI